MFYYINIQQINSKFIVLKYDLMLFLIDVL